MTKQTLKTILAPTPRSFKSAKAPFEVLRVKDHPARVKSGVKDLDRRSNKCTKAHKAFQGRRQVLLNPKVPERKVKARDQNPPIITMSSDTAWAIREQLRGGILPRPRPASMLFESNRVRKDWRRIARRGRFTHWQIKTASKLRKELAAEDIESEDRFEDNDLHEHVWLFAEIEAMDAQEEVKRMLAAIQRNNDHKPIDQRQRVDDPSSANARKRKIDEHDSEPQPVTKRRCIHRDSPTHIAFDSYLPAASPEQTSPRTLLPSKRGRNRPQVPTDAEQSAVNQALPSSSEVKRHLNDEKENKSPTTTVDENVNPATVERQARKVQISAEEAALMAAFGFEM